MTTLTTHTIESAPAASKPLLEGSVKAFGMLPHLKAIKYFTSYLVKLHLMQKS